MIKRFNRYELKYILPIEQCDRIIEDLHDFAHPDSYGGYKGYRIVSLYYDSPTLDCFWAKIEGLKYRRKIRLRIYPGEDIEATQRGMVEIKQRINRTVQKRRLELSLDEADQLCSGNVQLVDLDLLDQQVASEVQYLVNAMHLQPAGITAYWRRAFVGDLYDAGLRITFDTDLRFRAHALTVNLNADNHLFMSPSLCVMEVKANETIPNWVTSLLARHNCQLHRVSKYCAGMAWVKGIHVMPLTISPIGDKTER
jgi:SPX domain protein involved in polyphosphate accumulation